MINAAQVMRNQNAAALEAMRAAYSTTSVEKTGETGRAMGMTLSVEPDPMAELMDSMEEISMMFEETKTREIAKRRVGGARGADTSLADMIRNLEALFPDLPDRNTVLRLLEYAQTLARTGGAPQDLLKELARSCDDPATQYALLEMLEKDGGLDPAAQALVKAARQALFAEKGAAIRAGLNIAGTIGERTASPAEVKELRNLYRSEVLGFSSPQACFRSLLAQKGLAGISTSLQFLLQSCGIDMQSAHPSRSMTELSRILSDLQCVDVLTTVMEQVEDLAARTATQFGEKGILQGNALAERLLVLTEQNFISPETIAKFIEDAGVQQLLAKVYFLTGMIGQFRLLSPRLFADESGREQMVDAAQEHLDGLVEKQAEKDEEEERAKGGRS